MTTIDMANVFDDSKTLVDNSTLSSRLVYALTRLKISQSELARRLGIKPQIIQYLCTSNANKSKFAYELATALDINPNWLIAGKGPMLNMDSRTNATSSQQKVPILAWNDVTKWLTQDIGVTSQTQECIFSTTNISHLGFALRVSDTSMAPRFEVGTVLIIDPETKPKDGDFVVVQTLHQEQPIIRQLFYKNMKHLLTPINTAMYKEIELGSMDDILGVLRQTYYEFVRT